MKIGIIGCTGHVGYVLDGIKDEKENTEMIGIAPGSQGENVDALCSKVRQLGYQSKQYDNYTVMLDEVKPDIAVVACFFDFFLFLRYDNK